MGPANRDGVPKIQRKQFFIWFIVWFAKTNIWWVWKYGREFCHFYQGYDVMNMGGMSVYLLSDYMLYLFRGNCLLTGGSMWDKKSGTKSTTSEQTGCNFDQVYVTNIAGMSEHLSSNYILYVFRINCVFVGGFHMRQAVWDHEHYFWTKTGLNRTTNKKENVQ